jgi:Uncharacterized protein conserved in bacteria
MARRGCIAWVALGLALAGAAPALADDYPEHELHSIVNFQAGSPMDILTRWYGARLSELAGKPVIVENKLGAQGAIATDYVARAKPDGYTFMITPASSTLAEVAFIFKRLGFDPVKHLDPVLLMAKSGLVVVVDARNPVNTIAELTEALRKKPGNGAYGALTNISIVAAELYKAKTKLLTNQVFYKGIYENLLDLYGGQIDFTALDPAAAFEAIRCRQAQGACGHLGHAPRSTCGRADHAGSGTCELRLDAMGRPGCAGRNPATDRRQARRLASRDQCHRRCQEGAARVWHGSVGGRCRRHGGAA